MNYTLVNPSLRNWGTKQHGVKCNMEFDVVKQIQDGYALGHIFISIATLFVTFDRITLSLPN